MSERKRADQPEARATKKIVITRSAVRAATRPEPRDPPEGAGPTPTWIPPSTPNLMAAARVALSDVPMLIDAPNSSVRDPSVNRLLSAIDGELTVVELAASVNLDAESARTIFAELEGNGHVAFKNREQASSDVESIRRAGTTTDARDARDSTDGLDADREQRSPEYWLSGLQPRRK